VGIALVLFRALARNHPRPRSFPTVVTDRNDFGPNHRRVSIPGASHNPGIVLERDESMAAKRPRLLSESTVSEGRTGAQQLAKNLVLASCRLST
jgi:hypothetical protein